MVLLFSLSDFLWWVVFEGHKFQALLWRQFAILKFFSVLGLVVCHPPGFLCSVGLGRTDVSALPWLYYHSWKFWTFFISGPWAASQSQSIPMLSSFTWAFQCDLQAVCHCCASLSSGRHCYLKDQIRFLTELWSVYAVVLQTWSHCPSSFQETFSVVSLVH